MESGLGLIKFKGLNIVQKTKADLGLHLVKKKKLAENLENKDKQKEPNEGSIEYASKEKVLRMSPSFVGVKLPAIRQAKRSFPEKEMPSTNSQNYAIKKTGASVVNLRKKHIVYSEDYTNSRANKSLNYKQ